MDKLKNITILVNSCDAYEEVWLPFFSALQDHWPKCDLKIILNTESKSFALSGLKISCSHLESRDKVEWGERLKKTISKIESDYTLMLFDDFILDRKVNIHEIEKCLDRMISNEEIAAFYFISQTSEDVMDDHRFDGYKLINHQSNYKINSAPGLWRTNRLQQYTGNGDTPWAWEFFGTARTYRTKDLFYTASLENEQTLHYDYKRGGAIHRGKWVTEVISPALEKYKIDIDLTKRGTAPATVLPHTLLWKIKFIHCGWKMIGLDVFIFIRRAILKRIPKLI